MCDHRESPLRRDSIYKCYSGEKQYSSRECYSRSSSTVCYVCGRQKGHISRECPLIESGYSSGHSSDRMRRHERRTEDRDRSPLYSSRRRYKDKCSVSVGTVRFASRDNIVDGHYDSLFDEHPSSIKSTRYGRVVKPVRREGTIYY